MVRTSVWAAADIGGHPSLSATSSPEEQDRFFCTNFIAHVQFGIEHNSRLPDRYVSCHAEALRLSKETVMAIEFLIWEQEKETQVSVDCKFFSSRRMVVALIQVVSLD